MNIWQLVEEEEGGRIRLKRGNQLTGRFPDLKTAVLTLTEWNDDLIQSLEFKLADCRTEHANIKDQITYFRKLFARDVVNFLEKLTHTKAVTLTPNLENVAANLLRDIKEGTPE